MPAQLVKNGKNNIKKINFRLYLDMFKNIIIFTLSCLLLNNCAPQATNTIDSGKLSKYEIEEELRSKIEIDKRLKTIGNKFNNEFLSQCKNKKNYIGISLISEKEIKRQLGGTNTNIMSFGGLVKKNIFAYQNIIGSIDKLKIVYTVPGSPAYLSGLKDGDQIIKVNGKKLETSINFFNEINKKDSNKILIDRRGTLKEFTVNTLKICDFNFESFSTLDRKIVFFRSDNTLFLSQTLLKYLKNDDELVMIFANEFTHYVNGHPSIKTDIVRLKNSILFSEMWKPFGGIIYSSGKASLNFFEKVKFRYTKSQEGLADFSSIKLTKILGYNADKAKLFWERLVKEKPSNNIIAKFRDVDSNKIRIINYTLDEETIRFPNKNDYDKFKMKHNL